jgi:ATP-dependent DNA ligase
MFHNYRALTQFAPARAKKKLEIQELTDKHRINYWEEKIDGERYILHTDVGGPYKHALTSRRQSEVTGRMVEKTDRVPSLTNHLNLPAKSMLDNELVSSGDLILRELPGWLWDKLIEPNHSHMKWLKTTYGGALPVYPTVANTVSILGSLGPEAVRKQEERGLIKAYCFDIIQYMGKDISQNTQIQRRRFLASLLEPVDPSESIILMPAWQNLTLKEVEFFFYLITDPFSESNLDGGEGLIGKDPTKKYNAAGNWFKIKRDWPVDVVYTGKSIEGTYGKTGIMDGMAASLEVGVYYNNILQPIGWVSAIRDGIDNLQTPEEHAATWAGKVIECRHNGLQKKDDSPLGYTLRHPRFRRNRPDKNPTDCTFEAMYTEACKKLD